MAKNFNELESGNQMAVIYPTTGDSALLTIKSVEDCRDLAGVIERKKFCVTSDKEMDGKYQNGMLFIPYEDAEKSYCELKSKVEDTPLYLCANADGMSEVMAMYRRNYMKKFVQMCAYRHKLDTEGKYADKVSDSKSKIEL